LSVFIACCVGSGLYDGQIVCSEESYWMYLIVCDLRNHNMERPKV